ncbi:transcriptional regulator [Escherichia coli]|nr:transcriptional regulator [Escherichia coli]
MNTQYALKTLNQLRPVLIGFRKANGLTQRDVSERLGVTQQTYARLEANPASVGFDVCLECSASLEWRSYFHPGNHCQMQSPNTELCTMILHFQPGGRNGDAMRFPV